MQYSNLAEMLFTREYGKKGIRFINDKHKEEFITYKMLKEKSLKVLGH